MKKLLFLFLLLLIPNRSLFSQTENDNNETLSRFRFFTGTYDFFGKDPNFLYKDFMLNLSYRTSEFTYNPDPLSLKFSFQAGSFFSSASETKYGVRKDYSLHFVSYAKLGPELHLFENVFAGLSAGFFIPFYDDFFGALLTGSFSLNFLKKISDSLNLEFEAGVIAPYFLYIEAYNSIYFMIGISYN